MFHISGRRLDSYTLYIACVMCAYKWWLYDISTTTIWCAKYKYIGEFQLTNCSLTRGEWRWWQTKHSTNKIAFSIFSTRRSFIAADHHYRFTYEYIRIYNLNGHTFYRRSPRGFESWKFVWQRTFPYFVNFTDQIFIHKNLLLLIERIALRKMN